MWAHAARGIALSMRGRKARGCSDAMVLAGTITSTHACVPEQCSRADPCAKPLRARHIDRTVIFGGRSVQPTAISARLRAAMSDGAKRTCDHTVCGLTLTRTCARVRVRVRVRACACARARARLRVRVRACVYSCRHLRAGEPEPERGMRRGQGRRRLFEGVGRPSEGTVWPMGSRLSMLGTSMSEQASAAPNFRLYQIRY